jgi:hypothetical protein
MQYAPDVDLIVTVDAQVRPILVPADELALVRAISRIRL